MAWKLMQLSNVNQKVLNCSEKLLGYWMALKYLEKLLACLTAWKLMELSMVESLVLRCSGKLLEYLTAWRCLGNLLECLMVGS
jgi:hypothetical protein